MQKNKLLFYITCFITSVFLLSACNSIEYRGDKPKKKELSEISKNIVDINEKWSKKLSSGSNKLKPDSNIVLANAKKDLISVDFKGNVFSLNKSNGDINWQKNLKGITAAGPTYKYGKVLIACDDGTLYLLNAKDGKKIWDVNLGSEILSLAKMDDSAVYLQSLNGAFTALDIKNGRQLWRVSLNSPDLVLRKSSSPEIVDDKLVVGFASGKIAVISKADGSMDWAEDVAKAKGRSDLQRMIDISADPIVEDGVIYAVSYQGNLSAMSFDTGQMLWQIPMSSHAGMVKSKDKLFVSTTSGAITAIDKITGEVAWSQEELAGRDLSKPSIIKNMLLVGDEDGMMHVLDLDSGKILSRFKVSGSSIEAPAIVENNIAYILSKDTKVTAIELKRI